MKKDIFLCIAVVGMLAFTACNSSTQTASQQSSVEITSEESSKAETSDNKPDKEDNSTIAKVTAVTDHSISVVTAKMPEENLMTTVHNLTRRTIATDLVIVKNLLLHQRVMLQKATPLKEMHQPISIRIILKVIH